MVSGGIISLAILGYGSYHTFSRINQKSSFLTDVLPELNIMTIQAAILLLPAVAMYFKKPSGKSVAYTSILYPILLFLGFFNILTSDDALAAGLPMIMIVFPYCIIYGIIVLSR